MERRLNSIEEEMALAPWPSRNSHPHSDQFRHLMPGFYGRHDCFSSGCGPVRVGPTDPANIEWFIRHLREAAGRGRA